MFEENGANPGKPFLNAPSILLDDSLRPCQGIYGIIINHLTSISRAVMMLFSMLAC